MAPEFWVVSLFVYWLQIYPLTSDIQKAENLLSLQGSLVKQKQHGALTK